MDALFPGFLLVLADAAAIAGLIASTCLAAQRLLATRRRGGGRRPLARARARLIAAAAALALALAANGWLLFWISNVGPRITSAQAVGTWAESDGGGDATVQVFPDGTFTAEGLPPDINNASSSQAPVQAIPVEEQGTWLITSPEQDYGEPAIVCSLAGGPQFQLTFGNPPTLGSPLEAEFTYVQGQFSEPTIYEFTKH